MRVFNIIDLYTYVSRIKLCVYFILISKNLEKKKTAKRSRLF